MRPLVTPARSHALARLITDALCYLGLSAILLCASWSHAQSPKATTTYGYDELNRITSVTTAAGTVNITYDRTSLPVEVRYPNGVITRMAYDGAKRMKSVATLKVAGAAEVELEKTTYTFDLNGNRVSQTRVVSSSGSVSAETETTTYTYDLDDRLVGLNLTRISGGNTVTQTLTWELDRVGNRLKETSTGSQPSLNWLKVYAYDARDRITRIDTLGTGTGFNAAGTTTFDYDPNGNLTQKTRGATQRTFIWNARDRLVEVREGSLLLSRYKYNAEGFRDEIEGERRTTWVGGFAYLDKDMANGFLARYEAAPNGRSPLMVATPNGIEYLHADSLGSTTLATDSSGASKAATRFDALGNAETQGSTRNKFGFTGHEPDKNTGLIYFKARHYDPELGRFISADPYEGEPNVPLSWNGYLYANGNPLYYVDRRGYASDPLSEQVEPKQATQGSGSAAVAATPCAAGGIGAAIRCRAAAIVAANTGSDSSISDAIRATAKAIDDTLSRLTGSSSPSMTEPPAVTARRGADYSRGELEAVKARLEFEQKRLAEATGHGNRQDVVESARRELAHLRARQASLMEASKPVPGGNIYINPNNGPRSGLITESPSGPGVQKPIVETYPSDPGIRLPTHTGHSNNPIPQTGTPPLAPPDGSEFSKPYLMQEEINGKERKGDPSSSTRPTAAQQALIEILRNGGEISVSTIEEARALLNNMPELRPATQERLMPNPRGGLRDGFKDPPGTYRGDLINKQDPSKPIHPNVQNTDHANNPHYNIVLPNGDKATIIISGKK